MDKQKSLGFGEDGALAGPSDALGLPRLKVQFGRDFGHETESSFEFFVPDIAACAMYNPNYMMTAHCVAADFYSTQFVEFCKLQNTPPRPHRKLWEFAFIHETLRRSGAIGPGRRGIGFGVGGDCMTAVFVAEGCDILATDAPAEISKDWINTDQWSDGISRLLWPTIVPDELVRQKAEFMICDMNAVPDFERKFDFCWSSCCFEHLGSIQKGFDFIVDSVEKCLVPGGVSCHTSEFNLSSNEHTLSEGSTVLFRRRDIEELGDILRARGHEVSIGRFDPGNSFIDGLVDVPPYSEDTHLRLKFDQYVTTSFGLAVRRAR